MTDRHGTVERLDRATVEAGQYWRSREKIPARTGHGSEPSRAAVPAGRVLLVKSLRFVDGDLHTVILARHPTDRGADDLRFLDEEFHEAFAFEPRGVEIRADEVATLTAEIRDIQSEIVSGPAGLLPMGPAMTPDIADLVKNAGASRQLVDRAESQIVAAKKRASWIQDRTKRIAAKVEIIGAFHSETAEAALAAVEGTIREVERIKTGLRSVRLYTGEDVEVETVATGSDAAPDEPLTIFQQRLYLDEELGVELSKGGIDSETFGNLSQYVAANPGFIDRVAPSPRSVVLMSLRRRPNLPEELRSARDILEALEKMRMDTAGFLLVRNGANIHLVWSDLVWSPDGTSDNLQRNGLDRLFPTRGDLDRPFKGYDGRDISVADLDYTDARKRFDDRGLAYKRLLILLWGLNDRLDLFGRFYDRQRFETWTDLRFQTEHFRFVADEEFGLPVARMPVREFIKSRNGLMQHGSRVIGRWHQALHDGNAPKAFRWERATQRHRAVLQACEPVSVAVVKRAQGRLSTVLPGRDFDTGRPRSIAVDLDDFAAGSSRTGLLCLDGLHSSDLTPYVESRRDRAEYDGYLWLFTAARNVLLKEEAEQSALIGQLQSAVPQASGPQIAETIRVWRASHGGKPAPAVGSKSAAAMAVLLSKAVAGVSPTAPAGNRTIVRLSLDAAANHIRWSMPAAGEIRQGPGDTVWALREVVSDDGVVTASSFEAMSEFVNAELVLQDPGHSGALPLVRPPDGLRYSEWTALLAELSDTAPARFLLRGNPSPSVLAGARERIRLHSKAGSIERVRDLVPFGLAPVKGDWNILVLIDDPIHIHARGSDEAAGAVRHWIRTSYMKPQSWLEKLDEVVNSPGWKLGRLTFGQWLHMRKFGPDSVAPMLISPFKRIERWRQELESERIGADSMIVEQAMADLLDGAEAGRP